MKEHDLADYILKTNSFRKLDWQYIENELCRMGDYFPMLLRQTYHSLTEEDVKILLLMRLKLSNKEIAELLNIFPTSFRLRRYRIKQKLSITDKKMCDWIENLYC